MSNESKETISITLDVPKYLMAYIQMYSTYDDISKEDFIKYAIANYVHEKIWEDKQIEKSLKASQDPDATYLSHEDFGKWVECLGTENEYELFT